MAWELEADNLQKLKFPVQINNMLIIMLFCVE